MLKKRLESKQRKRINYESLLYECFKISSFKYYISYNQQLIFNLCAILINLKQIVMSNKKGLKGNKIKMN